MASSRITNGRAINTEVRSIAVSLKTKATVTDVNHKLRGQWFKGMTTRNDNFVVDSDANIIFNDNSVKNRKAMLIRMWANASEQMVSFCKDGKFRLVNFNDETETFELGGVVDFDVVQAELDAQFGREFKVSLITTANELAVFKAANADQFVGVKKTALDGGLVRIEFVARGVEAPLVFAVELSSVAENFSPNRKVAPIQSALLATFKAAEPVARKTIKKHSSKVARTIELAASGKVNACFDFSFGKETVVGSASDSAVCHRNSLAEIIVKANKNHNPRDLFRALAQKWPNGFTVKGSTAEGTRHWTVNVPTHILSVQGGFDKNGWSFDAKVMDAYAFLLLLADKAACPQLIADYAMGIGAALDGWKRDVANNKKAFTKGSAVFMTNGMKVLSNPEAGFEIHGSKEIPVILVDESNPLVTGEAISKDGKVAKKISDGDVVFFYRNPVVDLTPAVIRVTKGNSVCGKFTCAVAPSVLSWSSQTDNDGDVLWVIPAKQVGIRTVDTDEKASVVAGGLMNHVLVGKDLAIKTMDAFGCDNLFAGIIKSRDEFSVKGAVHGITLDVIAEAEAVAKHYRVRVGQGYAAMFNAFSSFIRKSNNGGAFTAVELQAIKGCSFVLYEEWGLAGFTQENETAFGQMSDLAKAHLGLVKASNKKALSRFSKGSKSVAANAVKEAAAVFVAQHKVRSRIERNQGFVAKNAKAVAIKEEALVNGLFRTLTKGAHSFESDNINPIFVKASVDAEDVFADALAAWQTFAVNGLNIA